MDEVIEKIPNWLRYILAIPFGIICSILIYYVGYFSNLWIASPDSLMIKFYDYIYSNVINILIFMITMSYMLPKHQFKFVLTISIIFCSLSLIVIGMAIVMNTITLQDLIGMILSIVASIWSCFYIYNEFSNQETIYITKEDKEKQNDLYDKFENISQDKFITLSNIMIKGMEVSNIDEALDKSYEFYKQSDIKLDDINLEDENKYKTLSIIMMRALETNNIDDTINKIADFYKIETNN